MCGDAAERCVVAAENTHFLTAANTNCCAIYRSR
jgi:hypothetical protein